MGRWTPARAEAGEQPLGERGIGDRHDHPRGGDDAGDHHGEQFGDLIAVGQGPLGDAVEHVADHAL